VGGVYPKRKDRVLNFAARFSDGFRLVWAALYVHNRSWAVWGSSIR
jgi:hypothetical protein